MREMTYAQALREALTLEMRRDERVFILGEDVGVFGGTFGVTEGMIDEFGEERVKDTPISEAVIVGAAAGAALMGMRPVAEIMFSDFLTIAMDQLVNQAAKIHYMFDGKARVPMVVRAAAGAGTGAAAQHSQCPEAWVCNVPGLKVVVPSTPADAKGLLTAAIRDDNPVVFLEQKTLYATHGSVPEGDYAVPLGKADVKRAGDDVTIVSYGRMVPACLEAAELLAAREDISAEVVDLRTLVPLDRETLIASVKKTGRLLIVHEASLTGGFGGELAATVAESDAFAALVSPIRRCCGLDVPVPFSPGLEASVAPTAQRVANEVKSMVCRARRIKKAQTG